MVMFLAITAALFVAVLLVLVRLFVGPTLYDRVLAVNTFGTLTVLILSSLGFVTERPDFLDIAMLYALINFVSTIAILKFFRYRTFGRTTASQEEA
ncbi:monovalent cation/H+ antiporter complex subunit F [Parvibaculum sp.]|mgnify:CR=1 FL=1|jgi:multicomponent Na+:H+ antiporter subunit F|uniref:monovalent cation/H+ antiporter complex subunit F n=1 Tax=Parvibaculum sp. TaxID=2024848 RepID=UPI001B0AADFB|nr:monovalent cation/H+ antiporter complex subunit F [Parvibaculum sp.]MBO6669191.1 pH regulation protein F [Parvibaculum sp.]MBO6692454.1 pH regulation protein F [Parvibaculum sp.]MBO6713043.1 pH regulation protein F [Parvibaculum sp.]|tara:strand:- start:2 stop:289 length:288 start_codon:yes stop_codon:yes gene_type:complete